MRHGENKKSWCSLPDTLRIETAQRIMDDVCAKQNVTMGDLLGKRRDKSVIAARHEAVRRVWNETRLSALVIARLFNSDHTTIMFICGRAKTNRPSPAAGVAS